MLGWHPHFAFEGFAEGFGVAEAAELADAEHRGVALTEEEHGFADAVFVDEIDEREAREGLDALIEGRVAHGERFGKRVEGEVGVLKVFVDYAAAAEQEFLVFEAESLAVEFGGGHGVGA